MWRVDRIGKVQVWYSEEEYNELLKSIKVLEDKIFYLEQENQVYKESYLEWCEQQKKQVKRKKKQTNFEKLKNMSLKEFLDFMTDVDDASEVLHCKMCLYCAKTKYENGNFKFVQCCDDESNCRQGIKEWLKLDYDNYF